MSNILKIHSDYQPSGDQPNAIKELVAGINNKERNQVLLGVTGSGKTFTIANVIEQTNRPTLIMAPNKTLAAQLYGEMKEFFPENAVEYFVSYYDYYQPEAYVAKTDTYIEKESSINEQIDRMRHSATRALLERRDVIVVASVSCIYGIGDIETYSQMNLEVKTGDEIDQRELIAKLVELQYKRSTSVLERGSFRVNGDIIDIFPVHLEDRAWRLEFFGDELESITEFDPLLGKKETTLDQVKVYPCSHHVTPKPTINQAIKLIKQELEERLKYFKDNGKLLEAQRLEERVKFDLEMLSSTGFCSGIENYSRYLTGRNPGEAPPTLFEYLPDDALLVVDESHVAVPQIGGMFKGDRARKENLANYGFRLPSCKDNRPLKFDEWDKLRPQTIFVSATPGDWEIKAAQGVVTEQIIRPTGLVDPVCEVRPTEGQVDDLIHECHRVINDGNRVMVTTLTKKMAEALSDYLSEAGLKVKYLHSDIDTLERIEIIRDLRLGEFDVLIGINLLREGMDIPECGLMAILDADKEGFLRSRTSLIQTIGRAARNAEAKVILYADKVTGSMQEALQETERRRKRQIEYNTKHGITPKTVKKDIRDIIESLGGKSDKTSNKNKRDHSKILSVAEIEKQIKKLEKEMYKAAENLDFERAAELRDEIKSLQKIEMI